MKKSIYSFFLKTFADPFTRSYKNKQNLRSIFLRLKKKEFHK